MQVADPLGYQKPAEFYSPKYETDRQRNAPERDLRTTVYWNPMIQIDNEIAEIEFYSADDSVDYNIEIYGLVKNTPLLYHSNLKN